MQWKEWVKEARECARELGILAVMDRNCLFSKTWVGDKWEKMTPQEYANISHGSYMDYLSME